MYKDKRYDRYIQHRNAAPRDRGIPFNMTFAEWWDIWEKSGHWEDRGHCKGQYCMSRYGDLGPYEIGNVFIQLHSDNVIQAWTGRKQKQETKDKIAKSRVGTKKSPETIARFVETMRLRRENKQNGR